MVKYPMKYPASPLTPFLASYPENSHLDGFDDPLIFPARASSNYPRFNSLQPLASLFPLPILCFQRLAASFAKTPGVGVPSLCGNRSFSSGHGFSRAVSDAKSGQKTCDPSLRRLDCRLGLASRVWTRSRPRLCLARLRAGNWFGSECRQRRAH
jgi:hypothetical protein